MRVKEAFGKQFGAKKMLCYIELNINGKVPEVKTVNHWQCNELRHTHILRPDDQTGGLPRFRKRS